MELNTSQLSLAELTSSGTLHALKRQILRLMLGRSTYGITASEAAFELYGTGWGLGLQGVTPRFAELQRAGHVCKADFRRVDPITGRSRQVWWLTDSGAEYAKSLLEEPNATE